MARQAEAMQAVNQLAFEVAALDREDRATVMSIAAMELHPILTMLTADERQQVIERMAEIIDR